MIYRAEVIGSMLRPAGLKEARAKWQTAEIATAAFKKIEDAAVNDAIALQESAGVDVITDGELRRNSFLGPPTDTVDGLGRLPETIGAQSQWHEAETAKSTPQPARPCVAVTGKLRRRRSLAAEEFSSASARDQTDQGDAA
jgi:5-methyltetrahydropteroyltriglutamate--homocysteine methyltransferase